MSNIFLWSDLHLGDEKIAGFRGYDNVTDHDDAVLTAWNETIGPRDVVHFLGDLSIHNVQGALDQVAKLPGEKRIIWGNHDPAHPMYRRSSRYQRRFMEVFSTSDSIGSLRVGKHKALLSHFPYTRDHSNPDRHPEYRLRDEGMPLIHGHVHGLWKVRLSASAAHGTMINVGVDVRPKPVPLSTIKEILTLTERQS